MTDLPTLKLKTVVNFPANAFGRNGITVAKEGGNFYVDIDYAKYTPALIAPGDVPNLYMLLWNGASQIYQLAAISGLAALFSAGITRVITAAGNVTAGTNDSVIALNKTVNEPTMVQLPLAINKAGPLLITDLKGSAGAFNITITPTPPETIMGLAQWTIAGDLGSVDLRPVSGVGYVL
jgi:hypothetical protein